MGIKKKLIKIISTACASLAVAATMMIGHSSAIKAQAADFEYALFPGDTLQINQGAFNEYNAYSHSNTNAFDLGGNSNYAAPFTGKIVDINKNYHMVMFQSLDKVYYADGTLDYMTVSFTHDNSIKDLYVGKVIKQGQIFYQPGVYPAGSSTGTHVHLAVFRGKVNTAKYKGNVYPNDALWLKKTTKVKQTGNYCWSTLNKNGKASTLRNGAIVTISPKNTKLYISETGKKNLSKLKLTNKLTNASKWIVHKEKGYIYLTNLESGKAMDIYGSTVAPMRALQIYTRQSSSSKTQNLIAKPNGAGLFALQSWSNKRVVIDCKGAAPKNNGSLWTYNSLRNNCQLFKITVVG